MNIKMPIKKKYTTTTTHTNNKNLTIIYLYILIGSVISLVDRVGLEELADLGSLILIYNNDLCTISFLILGLIIFALKSNYILNFRKFFFNWIEKNTELLMYLYSDTLILITLLKISYCIYSNSNFDITIFYCISTYNPIILASMLTVNSYIILNVLGYIIPCILNKLSKLKIFIKRIIFFILREYCVKSSSHLFILLLILAIVCLGFTYIIITKNLNIIDIRIAFFIIYCIDIECRNAFIHYGCEIIIWIHAFRKKVEKKTFISTILRLLFLKNKRTEKLVLKLIDNIIKKNYDYQAFIKNMVFVCILGYFTLILFVMFFVKSLAFLVLFDLIIWGGFMDKSNIVLMNNNINNNENNLGTNRGEPSLPPGNNAPDIVVADQSENEKKSPWLEECFYGFKSIYHSLYTNKMRISNVFYENRHGYTYSTLHMIVNTENTKGYLIDWNQNKFIDNVNMKITIKKPFIDYIERYKLADKVIVNGNAVYNCKSKILPLVLAKLEPFIKAGEIPTLYPEGYGKNNYPRIIPKSILASTEGAFAKWMHDADRRLPQINTQDTVVAESSKRPLNTPATPSGTHIAKLPKKTLLSHFLEVQDNNYHKEIKNSIEWINVEKEIETFSAKIFEAYPAFYQGGGQEMLNYYLDINSQANIDLKTWVIRPSVRDALYNSKYTLEETYKGFTQAERFIIRGIFYELRPFSSWTWEPLNTKIKDLRTNPELFMYNSHKIFIGQLYNRLDIQDRSFFDHLYNGQEEYTSQIDYLAHLWDIQPKNINDYLSVEFSSRGVHSFVPGFNASDLISGRLGLDEIFVQAGDLAFRTWDPIEERKNFHLFDCVNKTLDGFEVDHNIYDPSYIRSYKLLPNGEELLKEIQSYDEFYAPNNKEDIKEIIELIDKVKDHCTFDNYGDLKIKTAIDYLFYSYLTGEYPQGKINTSFGLMPSTMENNELTNVKLLVRRFNASWNRTLNHLEQYNSAF